MNYLELKDQVPNPPCTSPKRPNTPSSQKTQPSRIKIAKGSKKTGRDHQSTRRQYKVRLIKKPLVLPKTSATLVPTTAVTTATTTPSTISIPVGAITPWPSTSSPSTNLFVTRSWPKPHNEGITPMSVPEEKQEMKALTSKYKIPPTREISTSHPALSITQSSTTVNVMVAMNTPSPAKRCQRWGLPCPFCVQSTPHPSPVESD